MMYNKVPLIKLLVALVCVVAAISLTATSLQPQTEDVVGYEQSTRSYQSAEEESDLRFANVENFSKLYDALPSIATLAANQIYSQHYEKTSKLERNFAITSDLKKTDAKYQFDVKFSPSNTAYSVTINLKDATTRSYVLPLEAKK